MMLDPGDEPTTDGTREVVGLGEVASCDGDNPSPGDDVWPLGGPGVFDDEPPEPTPLQQIVLSESADIGVRVLGEDAPPPPATEPAPTTPTLPSAPLEQSAAPEPAPVGVPVRIRRVQLNARHRDARGRYFGPGAPVWQWAAQGRGPDFVRSYTQDDAVAMIAAALGAAVAVEVMPDA